MIGIIILTYKYVKIILYLYMKKVTLILYEITFTPELKAKYLGNIPVGAADKGVKMP